MNHAGVRGVGGGVRYRLWDALKSADFALFISAAAIVWGVVLILPDETFQLSPAYRLFQTLGLDEAIMGAAMTTMGVLEITTFLMGRLRAASFLLFAHTWFWAFVAALILLASPLNPSGGIYLLMAIYTGLRAYHMVRYNTPATEPSGATHTNLDSDKQGGA